MEVSKKKRSKGVTIFVWLMLVVGVGTMLGLDSKTFFATYKFLPQGMTLALYGYSIISVIVGFVSIIGILWLRDGMRKAAIVINALDVLSGLPFFFCIKGLRQSTYEMAQTTIKEHSFQFMSLDELAKVEFYSTLISAFGVMILSLIFIWFFTRPKVKEQFK